MRSSSTPDDDADARPKIGGSAPSAVGSSRNRNARTLSLRSSSGDDDDNSALPDDMAFRLSQVR